MTLLALACASVGGCTPSSGDGAAAANMDATDKGAIAPAAQADVARVPVVNVATPATLVARSLPAKPVRPVPAAPSLDLPASNAAATATAFPAEVTNFMVDRDGCDHFRGEEPYDAERAAYLEQSIRDLCTGSDAKLAKLRRRYAENLDVMAALGNYEDQIESPEEP
jgi:hypothetical protein